MQLLVRFLIGGTVVSLFALVGDVLRPKSFAGIFGAAPSVAVATLALTLSAEGPLYVATEARSMIIGAMALLGYTWASSHVLWNTRVSVPAVTLTGLILWLLLAVTGWAACLRVIS